MEPGINAPLFHPNCRCSTIPVVDDGKSNEMKQASGALWKDYENATNHKEKEQLTFKMEEIYKKYYDSMRNSKKEPIVKAIAKSYAEYTGNDKDISFKKLQPL